jgi:alpha-L-fucosidase 2
MSSLTRPNPLVWCSPSTDSSGSMPAGNGDLAANIWCDQAGVLNIYIAKSDSWGEFGQLYKVGLVRIRLQLANGHDLLNAKGFRWELDLFNGLISFSTKLGNLEIWVDAHAPVIHVQAEASEKMSGEISIHPWRTQRRILQEPENHGLHFNAPYPVWHGADIIPDLTEGEIAFLHRNEFSSWQRNLDLQGLSAFALTQSDPLLYRTFGSLIRGVGLVRRSKTILCSKASSRNFSASIIVLTIPNCPSEDEWIGRARKLADGLPGADDTDAKKRHMLWWNTFWSRSGIHAEGNEAARKVTNGYSLQRYLNACAGRGAYPIKFNGSLFSVDWNVNGERYDADYRRWGPGYWHQNTRLPYWTMLAAGDFEFMLPYFRMYLEALPLARERCRKFCGHAGAIFSEVFYFWGGHLEYVYGWPGRRDKSLQSHLPENPHVRLHNSGGLEVVFHAIIYYKYTGDEDFLKNTALPLAQDVIDYYDLHFPRKRGKLFIWPAQVLEQWCSAKNPLPEIAGLHACLDELFSIDEKLLDKRRLVQWQRLRRELPDLPTRYLVHWPVVLRFLNRFARIPPCLNPNAKQIYAPAQSWSGPPYNQENPELYCVFPYRCCNLDSSDLEMGRETFFHRTYKHDQGWAQDAIQAALLGLTEQALESVVKRFANSSAYARFPAFWGPNFDWIPDQCHGNVASHALQLMCLQAGKRQIHAFPAWPEDWQVEFLLHAPRQITVRGHHQVCGETRAETSDGSFIEMHLPQKSQ